VITDLIVFGGGAVADEVVEYVIVKMKYNRYDQDTVNEIFKYDDRYPDGKPGFISRSGLETKRHKTIGYVAAVGDGALRRKLAALAESYGFYASTIIASPSPISLKCEIGSGSIIAPGVYIGMRSKLGKGCLINYHAVVSHDCELGDYVTVAPNATLCGGVKVKSGAYIGANATIRDSHITIGENAIVGCGAVVLQDVPNNMIVVGVPAKPLRKPYENV
jgi:sugar O-acyltransferase (sialic acid O-acetyltransferase NeuD family)